MTINSKIISNTKHSNQTHQLVDICAINPTIKVNLIYATQDNFTKQVIYSSCARAYVCTQVAQALNNVQQELATHGYGLLIWDAYRPTQSQQRLWDVFPDPNFVAPPSQGGRHTRGTAVDVTLVDLKTGKEVEMPTPFDEFSKRAACDFKDCSSAALKHRTLLQHMMKKHGFESVASEWWHFDFKDWQKYPVLSLSFEDLSLNV